MWNVSSKLKILDILFCSILDRKKTDGPKHVGNHATNRHSACLQPALGARRMTAFQSAGNGEETNLNGGLSLRPPVTSDSEVTV
ncbi:hypothetical protein M8J75_012916 [Diaphorina citri]|nr:hypothetical protein M8J75_012916 [Diaphorina citri]